MAPGSAALRALTLAVDAGGRDAFAASKAASAVVLLLLLLLLLDPLAWLL